MLSVFQLRVGLKLIGHGINSFANLIHQEGCSFCPLALANYGISYGVS